MPALVNASAVGYYGDTRDRVVDETAPAGTRLPRRTVRGLGGRDRACAQRAGTRVVLLRTGSGAVARRRHAGADQAAVLVGFGRPTGQRQAVHAVDQPRGRGAGAAVRHRSRRPGRAGEPDRSRAGDQRRVHRRAGPGREPSDRPVGAGVRAAHRCSASSPTRVCSAGSARFRRRSSGPDSSSTTTPSARRWPTRPRPRTRKQAEYRRKSW